MAKNYDIALLFDFYGDLLTEKRRAVLEYYYNDDLSLSEIAEIEGVSRQGVHDTLKNGESLLLHYEEKLGLAERFRLICEKADEIAEAAATLRVNEDKNVCAAAEKIEKTAIELKSLG